MSMSQPLLQAIAMAHTTFGGAALHVRRARRAAPLRLQARPKLAPRSTCEHRAMLPGRSERPASLQVQSSSSKQYRTETNAQPSETAQNGMMSPSSSLRGVFAPTRWSSTKGKKN